MYSIKIKIKVNQDCLRETVAASKISERDRFQEKGALAKDLEIEKRK